MTWRGWKSWAFVLAILMVAMVPSVHAGPYEDAVAARNRGDNGPMYRLMRKLAEQGLAVAQYNVGLFYQTGQGVAQNYTEAMRWYRKAAEQGNVDAQFNLGDMYVFGNGVSPVCVVVTQFPEPVFSKSSVKRSLGN